MIDANRPAPEHVSPEALRSTRADLQRQVAALDLLLNADQDTLARPVNDLTSFQDWLNSVRDNVQTAATHNWFFHGRGKPEEIMEVPLEQPDDDWPDNPMRIRRTVDMPANQGGSGGQSNQDRPSRCRWAVGSPSVTTMTTGSCSGCLSRYRPASTSA